MFLGFISLICKLINYFLRLVCVSWKVQMILSEMIVFMPWPKRRDRDRESAISLLSFVDCSQIFCSDSFGEKKWETLSRRVYNICRKIRWTKCSKSSARERVKARKRWKTEPRLNEIFNHQYMILFIFLGESFSLAPFRSLWLLACFRY